MSLQLEHMAQLSQQQIMRMIRGISIRQVRLTCGAVLFTYLVSHFLNHALGNISMDALAAGVYYHTAFWRFLPVAIIFYAAALTHAAPITPALGPDSTVRTGWSAAAATEMIPPLDWLT